MNVDRKIMKVKEWEFEKLKVEKLKWGQEGA